MLSPFVYINGSHLFFPLKSDSRIEPQTSLFILIFFSVHLFCVGGGCIPHVGTYGGQRSAFSFTFHLTFFETVSLMEPVAH